MSSISRPSSLEEWHRQNAASAAAREEAEAKRRHALREIHARILEECRHDKVLQILDWTKDAQTGLPIVLGKNQGGFGAVYPVRSKNPDFVVPCRSGSGQIRLCLKIFYAGHSDHAPAAALAEFEHHRYAWQVTRNLRGVHIPHPLYHHRAACAPAYHVVMMEYLENLSDRHFLDPGRSLAIRQHPSPDELGKRRAMFNELVVAVAALAKHGLFLTDLFFNTLETPNQEVVILDFGHSGYFHFLDKQPNQGYHKPSRDSFMRLGEFDVKSYKAKDYLLYAFANLGTITSLCLTTVSMDEARAFLSRHQPALVSLFEPGSAEKEQLIGRLHLQPPDPTR